MSADTPAVAAAALPQPVAAVQARIAMLTQRIASLTGQTLAGASDTAPTSATFSSALALAQAQMDSSAATSSTGSTGAADGAPTGDQVVADATKYLGTPYKWGGTDPATGLDCSGLVQRVYADLGVSLPRVAADQAKTGTAVASLAQAEPGDLVVLDGGEHIGIYVGDGRMLHAPKTGDVVKVSKVWETPTAIRRLTADSSTTTSSAGSSASSALTALAQLRSAVLGASGTSGTSDPSGLTGLTGLTGLSSLAGLSGLTTAAATPSTTSTSGATAYQPLFDAATARYGLPSGLLSAVAQVESGYDPTATSAAGAQGLMQLMPGTAAGLGVDARDPAQAVDGAARLLRQHLATFGSVPLALAAYNAGAGSVTRYGGVPPFAETQGYVHKVTAAMAATA